jgi:hypothetical protein
MAANTVIRFFFSVRLNDITSRGSDNLRDIKTLSALTLNMHSWLLLLHYNLFDQLWLHYSSYYKIMLLDTDH